MAYKEGINIRNFKKETEWEKTAYKRYVFKCRIGEENNKLLAVLDGRPYADWVRSHLNEDYEKLKAEE